MSRIKKFKQPLALLIAVLLLFGLAPMEQMLAAPDNEVGTEELEDAVTSATNDAVTTEPNDEVSSAPNNTTTSEITSPIINTPFDKYTLLTPGATRTWSVKVSNLAVNPIMDIVYLVDRTGTMTPTTHATAEALSRFTEDLKAAGAVDINFGVARFGLAQRRASNDGTFNNPSFNIELPLGDHDVPFVQNVIRTLPTSSPQGGIIEDVLLAYMQVIDQTQWREGAQRVVVVVTDANTHLRPTFIVGGHFADLNGVLAITQEHNITPVLMGAQTRATNRLSDMAEALGLSAPIPRFNTASELEYLLANAVIPPVASLNDYYVEICEGSITYASDGALSTDVEISIDLGSFELRGGEIREFNFEAVAVDDPNRSNDTTIIEIGFCVNGYRRLETQRLEFSVDGYTAFHRFASLEADRDLPDEVLALLPASRTGLIMGTVVNPTIDFPTMISVGSSQWTFDSWYPESLAIIDTDVEFVGIWRHTGLEMPALTKSSNIADHETVEPGQQIEYTLTVTNPSDVDLADHLVVDDFAGGDLVGIRNVSVSPDSVNFMHEVIDGELLVFFDYLPANGNVEITFETLIAAGVESGRVVNTARLFGSIEDEQERPFIEKDYETVNVVRPEEDSLSTEPTQERPGVPPPPDQPPLTLTPPVLPQTGVAVGSLFIGGLALAGTGLTIAFKQKNTK